MLASLLARLKSLAFRGVVDAELDEELHYHLEREIERNIGRGMSPDDARAAAHRAFGNVSVATEQARDAWRWRLLEELRQDIVYAVRTFKRAPLFVVTLVGSIGLGLGLLSSAFTFFDAYVLRPMAVRDPYSLYDLSWQSTNGRKHRFSWAQYQRLRNTSGMFAESFAYTNAQARVRGRPAIGQFVTGNYFQMLGVPPAVGRVLLPSDAEQPGANAVVVLSHQVWRTMFGGDSSVIGTRIALNGATLTIVGVAREGFGGLTSAPFDFWVPVTMAAAAGPTPGLFGPRQPEGLFAVGRIPAGMTADRAASMFLRWMRAETADRQPLERASDVTLIPRGTSIPRNAETIATFAPVVVAFLLVMLTACANVANIMLARGMARQREIGIRLALGAGRPRLIRQLLTEAIVLAVPAGIVGFVISRLTIWLAIGVMFATVPQAYAGYLRVVPLDVDGRILAFMMLAAILAALLFGLVPALQATRPNIVQASRGDFDTQFRPSRLRDALVVAQVTLSVVLLICAGVLLGGSRHIERLEPGIRTQSVVQVELTQTRALRVRALDALRNDPLIRGIASSSSTPLDGMFQDVRLIAGNRPAERSRYIAVSPEYFPVLDLPIISGRGFTEDEARGRAGVTIVSQSTAKHFWPDRSPIGETLTIPATDRDFAYLEPYHVSRVIGVTRDAVPGWIGQSPDGPTVYYPQPLDADANRVIVRVAGDANQGRVQLERMLGALDSSVVTEMHTLDEALAVQVYPFRAMYWVASALGAIALLLTLIGVYGVMSYLVAQRRKEFGIRLALGAGGASLIALVLRQSLRLSLVGVAVGVVIALGVSRLFASVISNLDTFDAFGYVTGIGLVLVTCVVAAYTPSRRAAAVNPVEALRADS